jgi:hypothetical protein
MPEANGAADLRAPHFFAAVSVGAKLLCPAKNFARASSPAAAFTEPVQRSGRPTTAIKANDRRRRPREARPGAETDPTGPRCPDRIASVRPSAGLDPAEGMKPTEFQKERRSDDRRQEAEAG